MWQAFILKRDMGDFLRAPVTVARAPGWRPSIDQPLWWGKTPDVQAFTGILPEWLQWKSRACSHIPGRGSTLLASGLAETHPRPVPQRSLQLNSWKYKIALQLIRFWCHGAETWKVSVSANSLLRNILINTHGDNREVRPTSTHSLEKLLWEDHV